jgi:hypothetical protein
MGWFTKKPADQQTALASAPAPQQNNKADVLRAKLEHKQQMAALKAQQETDRRAEQQALSTARQAHRQAQRAAMRAGVQHLTGRALSAWRSHKQAKADAKLAPDTFKVEIDTLDTIEKGKLFFARAAMFLGAFLLMMVAAWSVGFFFAGMHDFTLSNQDTALIYGGSFALEAIFTGAMFTVGINKKRGRAWGLLFAGALVLALISVLAQFASYETQLQQGRLQVSDSAIESIPLLTWLIGSMKGHSFLFLLRGCAFHFAEILACLGMPSKKRTLQEQIGEMERVQRARIQFEEARLLADVRAAIALRVQDEMRARVGLPPPTTPLSLPKVTPESEGASNGHATFPG